MKKAFITGINGQGGSYLAELLLSKDYVISTGEQHSVREFVELAAGGARNDY